MLSALEKIQKRLAIDASTGCWNWTGFKTTLGYGRIHLYVNGKSRKTLAHRFAYETYIGPIPDSLPLDHLCRNPSCVNPDHLEPVTHKENILRGIGWGATNARKTLCSRGHSLSGPNLKLIGNRRDCRKCCSIRTIKWKKGKACKSN
jgi:hypothetical protein